MKSLSLIAATAVVLAAGTAQSRADQAVALVGDKTLVVIDLAKASATKTMQVSGVDRLLGIDVRPSNKSLYGVSADGTVVTIDTASGKAKKVAQFETMLPGKPTWAIVDFNPAADKLRFMGADGTNLRADVDTGKVTKDGSLAFEQGDMHHGEKPAIVAAAYINSYSKPEKTAMYDIDATIGALIQQTKPNDGTLKAIGKLGFEKAKTYAFDVHTSADGKNTAWLVADNSLYTVAIETGKATMVGKVKGVTGTIRDIAALAN
ncbi:MAG: DUF4394 domain-containing protein [Hyphomicrobiaceae bacterium]